MDLPPDLAPLITGATTLDLTLDPAQLQRFATYRHLLLDWNTRVNLTAITDPADILVRHFLDSLTLAPLLRAHTLARRRTPSTLLDLGSGAGFPGIPLAIVYPDWNITLIEATGKKVRFLEAVIAALALPNVRALTGRAEDLARQPDQRAHYTVVTARAVAALPTLLEYSAPFARVGGSLLFPKKGDLAAELTAGRHAAAALGAELLDPLPVTTPTLADGRVIVRAHQRSLSAALYPRPAGAPAKRPLGLDHA